jgi:hypothetical protein
MKYKVIIILLILNFSCKEKPSKIESIINSLSGDEVSQSFFSMNQRLISTIEIYESNISFSDTLIKGNLNRLNTEKIIENYNKSFDFADVEMNEKLVDSLYNSNHNYLIDSLISPFLFEYHNQQEELKEIEYIAAIAVTGKTQKYQVGSQLVKNQILYNHVFQFLLRHKLENELTTDIKFPLVHKDSLLANGLREMSIYITTSLEQDDYIPMIQIDTTIFDLREIKEKTLPNGAFIFQYDPKTISDSIEIRTYTTRNINGERKEVRYNYKTIKE